METLAPAHIELGVATVALPGQSRSGDLHLVKPFPNGILVAALDGVGHGEEAARAATKACRILEGHAEEPVISLVRQCHEGLRATRGVVMSIASLNVVHELMTWVGVGNVQGILLRPGLTSTPQEESLLLRAGVVGVQLPPLQAAVLPLSAGDRLIFATDGIRDDFARALARNQIPQKAAEMILAQHRKATDDALVLVARYLGNHK
jgi:phosphoserine phosphatase RsbX